MKHIAIAGKMQSKYLAPFGEPDTEIWSMNLHSDKALMPSGITWFDLHEEPQLENADYTKENFPFEACHELVHGRRFCSTMAYMIAFAILQGADKISTYGCKYTADGNPRRQRELHNVREMLFFAMGRGIEIHICEEDVDDLFPEHIPEDGIDFDQ